VQLDLPHHCRSNPVWKISRKDTLSPATARTLTVCSLVVDSQPSTSSAAFANSAHSENSLSRTFLDAYSSKSRTLAIERRDGRSPWLEYAGHIVLKNDKKPGWAATANGMAQLTMISSLHRSLRRLVSGDSVHKLEHRSHPRVAIGARRRRPRHQGRRGQQWRDGRSKQVTGDAKARTGCAAASLERAVSGSGGRSRL
jgi:hypothetical protein